MNAFLRKLQSEKPALIMSLPANDPELCAAAFEAGADAVKVHVNLEHRASGRSFGSVAENRSVFEDMLAKAKGPMGLVLGADALTVRRDMDAAQKLGFAFYSLYAHHAPANLRSEDKVLMAACDSSYSMEEAAGLAVAGASVLEASIVPAAEYGQPLTFRDLAKYSALVQAVALPVVVPTQRAILPEEVRALHRVGIRGVMIGAVVTGTERSEIESAVRAFRVAIDLQ